MLARHGVRPAVRHAANSAALFREAGAPRRRPSGHRASSASRRAVEQAAPLADDLRLVMRVRTEIVSLRDIAPGAPSATARSSARAAPARIATIPMGYADGLSRHLTNKGHVLVRGKRAPIVGAVSMDMTMIDVTDIAGVALRDEVVVLGAQEGPLGKDAITRGRDRRRASAHDPVGGAHRRLAPRSALLPRALNERTRWSSATKKQEREARPAAADILAAPCSRRCSTSSTTSAAPSRSARRRSRG